LPTIPNSKIGTAGCSREGREIHLDVSVKLCKIMLNKRGGRTPVCITSL
jgi:hypothetical protein